MRVDEFDFQLPQHLIATKPIEPRDASRLLHVFDNKIIDRQVLELAQLLRPNDLLIFNDTKVIPARFTGICQGATVEVTLHLHVKAGIWKVFARPAKKLVVGEVFFVAEDFKAIIIDRNGGEVTLDFGQEGDSFFLLLSRYGTMPLPPYMKREATVEDNDTYQTMFATHRGAVAAPTAGLHFTPRLLESLHDNSIKTATVTLHVGAGTFLPVKANDTQDHVMHKEYGVISESAVHAINETKANSGRIIAVGTTSLRLLESAVTESGRVHSYAQETGIFITPGYRFKVVDALMTNFHLPKSTLFMLVSAFSGLQTMKKAYKHAIDQSYRFYSYGDACFLERSND